MTRQLSALFLAVLTSLATASAQTNPADSLFYTVSYTEIMQSARDTASTAFRMYREASLKQDGYSRFELFEQIGRPGHYAVIETWRDQKAYEARGSAQKELADRLQPIRTSDYDQRPYKTLTVAPPAGRSTRQAVYVITHVDVSANPAVPTMLRQLAESSRKEPGNLRFDVYQHTMRANHFTILEAWQDDKAREAHAATAQTRKYRDELAPMTGSPLDERVFAAVE